MRRLADESNHMPLHAEGAEHDAGGFVHRLEDRPLLDVELEIGARIDRLQLRVRVGHPIEDHAVLLQRVDQRRPVAILQRAHLVDLEAPCSGRRSEQASTKARPFFVRPVDEGQRDWRHRTRVHPKRFEPRDDAETAVEPAAVRHRIKMAAHQDCRRRGAWQRHEIVAGGISANPQADLRHLRALQLPQGRVHQLQ